MRGSDFDRLSHGMCSRHEARHMPRLHLAPPCLHARSRVAVAELGVVRRFLASLVKPAILLLSLFVTVALGATDDLPIDTSDEIGPLVIPIVFIFLCILLFLVGVGIFVAATVAFSAAVLTALGIVSSAAFIGILRRRFSSGFRALHYQLFAVAALPAGIGVLWLGSHFFTTHLRHRDVLVIGSIAGICGGLLLAFAFDRLAGFAYRRFVSPSIPNATGNA